MNKRIITFCLALAATVSLLAEEVDRATALKKAQKFMPGKHFVESRPVASTRAGAPEQNAFYVFNAENDGGYVVVSGDDRTREILGYAERGHLDEERMPENMKWWLDNIASQIEALGTTLKPATRSAESSGWKAISPLIKTEWGQNTPFNYMCPGVNSEGSYVDYDEPGYDPKERCMTGCVATAMAQLMNYWQWPKTCPALEGYPVGYYVYENNEWVFVESKRIKKTLPATTFKWDKMKNTYDYKDMGEAADAVAELMRYCGQAVKMKYDINASGADLIPNDLIEAFNFSPNMNVVYRDYFTTAQWESIIYDELAAKRPVLFSGMSTNSGGHQFIVDGYRSDGFFHMNWGFMDSGSYSVLSVADPNSEYGVGGSDNLSAYHFQQEAMIGVKPPEDGDVLLPIVSNSLNNFPTTSYTRSNSDVDFVDAKLSGFVSNYYLVDPVSDLDIQIGWGLYQDDQFISCLGSETRTIPSNGPFTEFNNNMTVSFGAGLTPGKYHIYQIHRFSDSEKWKRCDYYGTLFLVAEVSDTKLILRMPDLESKSFVVNSITTLGEPEIGYPMKVCLNVTNTSESDKLSFTLLSQKSGASSWNKVIQGDYHVTPGQSADVVFQYTPEVSGTFTLAVTGTTDDILKTASVTIASNEVVTVDGVKFLCTPLYKRAKVIKNEEADKSVASVTIPPKVTASGVACQVVGIDEFAFNSYWNLTSLEIPEGVKTVGESAFSYCSTIQSIILPSTLTSIGERAFYNITNAETVISRCAHPGTIPSVVFLLQSWDEAAQEWVTPPSSATLYIPIGSRSAYEAAGWTAQFAKVVEGEPLETKVGVLKYAYASGGNEATVVYDESYQSLTEVTVPANVTIGGKPYKVTAIGNGAFADCNLLTTVTLEDGIESIGNKTFQSCSALSSIRFPSTLHSIGGEGFRYCTDLTDLVLPEGLESIGSYAFIDCTNMKTLLIPSTVKVIGENIIRYDEALTSVISCISEPFAVIDETFAVGYDYGSNTIIAPSATLYVPAGCKAKYQAKKGWNVFKTILEHSDIPGDVNGDLSVDQGDVDAIAAYIMAGKYVKRADLNNDNKVNAADIVTMLNILKAK